MFQGIAQPMHLVLIFAIALILFGPSKLAGLGKGLGEGIRGFRSALKEEPAAANPSTPEKKES